MGKSEVIRRCPKCGGNLYLEKDFNGWYEQCLQCAYTKDLKIVYENKRPVKVERS
jgi:DNA-directed RNA polymerase subunit M/transcription elongation factor TFIIS